MLSVERTSWDMCAQFTMFFQNKPFFPFFLFLYHMNCVTSQVNFKILSSVVLDISVSEFLCHLKDSLCFLFWLDESVGI